MKKILCIQIIALFMFGCSNFLKYHLNVVPKANLYVQLSERTAALYTGSNPVHAYGECIYKKIIGHVENDTISFGGQIRVDMISYIIYHETSSPYNYSGFIEYVKSGGFNNNTIHEWQKEPLIKELQFWTTVLYDSCGQYVYTIDERCAALAAVDLAPDGVHALRKNNNFSQFVF